MNVIGESYESISSYLGLESCVSYDPEWSAAPDFLKYLIEYCEAGKPETIVECSSGVTTLVLARCCQLNGAGHVYSLENGQDYARETIEQLRRYGLGEYVNVIHAPLENRVINDLVFDWYSVDELSVNHIDMLVIDGPPGFIQKNSRYPALPILFDRLSDGCRIFLDDAARADEKEIVESWLHEFTSLEHVFVENDRGCSVLTLK